MFSGCSFIEVSSKLIESVCWLSPEKTPSNTQSRSFLRTIPGSESVVRDVFEEDFDLITTRVQDWDGAALLLNKVNIKTKSHANLLIIESLFISQLFFV